MGVPHPRDRTRPHRTVRVVVAAWTGSDNLGDELIFSALARKLAAAGAAVTAVSVRPAATARAHGVAAVSHADVPGLLRALGEGSALVLGGGGLLQDTTSPFNLPYHLSRAWAAAGRRAPFAAVGLGAGPLDSRLGRRLVAATLARARAVSVRDAASARLLADLGVPAVTTADLAFALPTPGDPPADRIVASLRPWPGRRGRVPVAARTRDATPQPVVEGFAAGLDAAAARLGLPVRLVAFDARRDGAFHRRVAARMRAPVELAVPGLGGVLGEVARSRVVVAVRYHAAVGAVLAGRPAVVVGYAPKTEALAAELGGGGRLVAWGPRVRAELAPAAAAVAGHADDVAAARERLRAAERGNDRVLVALIEAAGRTRA